MSTFYEFALNCWTAIFLRFFEICYFLSPYAVTGWPSMYTPLCSFLALFAFLFLWRETATGQRKAASSFALTSVLQFGLIMFGFMLAITAVNLKPFIFTPPLWEVFEVQPTCYATFCSANPLFSPTGPDLFMWFESIIYPFTFFYELDLVGFLGTYFQFTAAGVLLAFLTAFLYTILLYSLTIPPIRLGNFHFFYIVSLLSLFVCFLTNNFFVFYLSFEFILIPFFVIVGVWGSRPQRLGAALRLVFFTVLFFSTPCYNHIPKFGKCKLFI